MGGGRATVLNVQFECHKTVFIVFSSSCLIIHLSYKPLELAIDILNGVVGMQLASCFCCGCERVTAADGGGFYAFHLSSSRGRLRLVSRPVQILRTQEKHSWLVWLHYIIPTSHHGKHDFKHYLPQVFFYLHLHCFGSFYLCKDKHKVYLLTFSSSFFFF